VKLLKRLVKLEAEFDVVRAGEGAGLEPRFLWPEVLAVGRDREELKAGRITVDEFNRRWAQVVRRGQRNAARGVGETAGELTALVAKCKARRAAAGSREAGQ